MPLMGFLAPIIAAVATAAGSIGSALSITTALTNFALATVSSLVLQGVSSLFSSRDAQRVQTSPASPRIFCYGVAPIGGRIVYAFNEGDDHLWIVYALATHECDEIQACWFEDRRYTFLSSGTRDGDASFRFFEPDDDGDLPELGEIFFFLGGSNQQTSAALVDETDSNPGEWTAAHRGRGICNVVISWEVDNDVIPRGVPTQSTFFEVRGKKLYDPRKDSTQGGIGSHRLNNPSTWEYSNNVALAWFDFRKGHVENGRLIFGHGDYPADLYSQSNPQIPRLIQDMIPHVISAANICDEQVPLRNGGNQRRYTIDAAFTTDLQESGRNQVDIAFKEACGGYLVDDAAGPRLIPGSASSPVYTFDNLKKFSMPTMDLLARTDRIFNVARPRYIEPDAIFGQFDAPPFSYAEGINEDGRIIPRDIALEHQSDGIRAQRLSKIALLQSRQGATITWLESLDALGVKAADRVVINDPDLGIDNEIYRIQRRRLTSFTSEEDNAAYTVIEFTAIEDPDDVYSWDPAIDEQPLGSTVAQPSVSRLPSPIISGAMDGNNIVINWQAVGSTQLVTFQRNLIGANEALSILGTDIDLAQNEFTTSTAFADGDPVYITEDVNGLTVGAQYYVRVVGASSPYTMSLHAANSDALADQNRIDLTEQTAFTLYQGPSTGAALQQFQVVFGQSGTITIANPVLGASYKVTAIASAQNINSSIPAELTIST